MSEAIEIFRATKEIEKAEKKERYSRYLSELDKLGIPYTKYNDGYHLRLNYKGVYADFWPSTGKYRVRPNGRYRTGLDSLLKDIGYEA